MTRGGLTGGSVAPQKLFTILPKSYLKSTSEPKIFSSFITYLGLKSSKILFVFINTPNMYIVMCRDISLLENITACTCTK